MRHRLIMSATVGLLFTFLVAGTVAAGIPVFQVTVTKTDAPDPVVAGTSLTYTIELDVSGGDGHLVELQDTLPAGTTFVSFTTPGGWTPTTPPVGGTGTVSATIADLLEGTYVFTLVVQVDAEVLGGVILTNTATVNLDDSDGRPVEASESEDTTVQAAPTPQASLQDAAMAPPSPVGPVATLGFGVLVIASLGAVAWASARRRAR
jgi:uncharacterized repeat protein (TIGR01451 family)